MIMVCLSVKSKHLIVCILLLDTGQWLLVETSTNQSDVIIRSDDRFLNLVVDSGLTLFFGWFFFCLHTDKNIAVLSQLVFFCPHTDKHLSILSKPTFDTQSIHKFGLVYYLSTSQNSPFYIRCYTYGKRSFVLF